MLKHQANKIYNETNEPEWFHRAAYYSVKYKLSTQLR